MKQIEYYFEIELFVVEDKFVMILAIMAGL